ncbi:MAG TPA: hypothetical protein VK789_07930 [Bryobacteraceae bacterium]|nr:hypothetical protein [Bryobacteraceae bacterium]
MKRIAGKALLGLTVFVALLYGCDYLYARVRSAPFADVRIERFLAIAEHFNKIGYERTTPVTERCVYSIFPHFGNAPCWYLTRHTVRFVKIG